MTIINTSDASDFYPVGTTIVTWTATDAANNTATCQQIIEVIDTSPPSIVCAPDQLLIPNDPGACGAEVTVVGPVVADNCCDVEEPIRELNVLTNEQRLANSRQFNKDLNAETNQQLMLQELETFNNNQADVTNDLSNIGNTANRFSCFPSHFVPPDGDGNAARDFGTSWSTIIGSYSDDFLVPPGNSWEVYQVGVLTFQEDDLLTGWSVRIKADNGGIPGAELYSEYIPAGGINYVLQESSGGGSYYDVNIPLSASVVLPANAWYWLEVEDDFIGPPHQFMQFGEDGPITGSEAFAIPGPDGDPITGMPLFSGWWGGAVGIRDMIMAICYTAENCESVSVTNDYNGTSDASDFYPIGTTVVTWTATDAAGNSSTCTQTIEVLDLSPPSIVCAPDQLLIPNDEGACGAEVPVVGPIFADNCCEASQPNRELNGLAGVNAFLNSSLGQNVTAGVVTTAGLDQSGGSTSLRTAVSEDIANRFNCAPSYLQPASGDGVSVTDWGVTWLGPNGHLGSWMDDFEIPAGDDWTVHAADMLISYRAGETLFTGWIVKIRSDIAGSPGPIIHSEYVPLGGPSFVLADIHPSGSERYEVHVPLVPFVLPAGNRYWFDYQRDNGAVEIFHRMIDPNLEPPYGSEAWGYFPPDLGPISNVFPSGDLDGHDMVFGICYNTEDCSSVSITNDYNGTSDASDFYPVGTHTVTWTAVDAAGNSTQCQQNIEVIDTSPPSIVCAPDQLLIPNDPGACGAEVTVVGPVLADNCCDVEQPDRELNGMAGVHAFLNSSMGQNANAGVAPTVEIDQSSGSLGLKTDVSEDIANRFTCFPSYFQPTSGDGQSVTDYGVAWTGPNSNLGTWMDDFEVPAGNDWTVNAADTYISYSAGETLLTGWIVKIRSDLAGEPGPIIHSEYVPLGGPIFNLVHTTPEGSERYEVHIPLVPFVLPAGNRYWAEFQMDNGAANIYQRLIDPNLEPPYGSELWAYDSADTIPISAFFGGLLAGYDMVFGICYDTENCETVSVTNDYNNTSDASDFYPVGTTVVTWTATDAAGNSSTCTQTIEVLDLSPPSIVCAPDQLLIPNDEGACGAEVPVVGPIIADNCCEASQPDRELNGLAGVNAFLNSSMGQNVTAGETPSFEIDESGGGSSGLKTITSEDIANRFNCSPSYFQPASGDGVSVTDWGVAFTGPGSSLRGWMDDFEILAGDDWTVHAADMLISYRPGETLFTGWTVIIRSDLAGTPGPIIHSEYVPLGGPSFNLANTLPSGSERYEVHVPLIPFVLPAGNRYWIEFRNDDETVDVFQRAIDPTLEPPYGSESWGNDGTNILPISTFFPGLLEDHDLVLGICYATDCETVSVTNDYNGTSDASDFYPVGTTVVTWTATDAAGNSSTCTQTIEVIDTEVPTIVCPRNITVSNDPGQCDADVTVPAPIFNDNCFDENGCVQTDDLEGYTLGSMEGQSANWVGWTPLSVEYGEVSNEQALSGTQSLKITGPPIFEEGVSNDQVYLLGDKTTGVWDVKFNLYIPNGNTGYFNIQKQQALFDWANEVHFYSNGTGEGILPGPNPAFTYPQDTWFEVVQTMDLDGDVATLTVNGVFVGAWTISAGNWSGLVQLGAIDFLPSSDFDPVNTSADPTYYVDDVSLCAVATNDYNDSADASDNYPVGTTTVVWTITDGAGNTATCDHTITVEDNEDPVAICPEDITQSNDQGDCGAIVFFDFSATDNCPGVTVVSVPPSGSYFDVGTTTVTVTATDVAGNSDVCTFEVTVNDDEIPTITCPEDILVVNDPGQCDADVTVPAPTFTDNCFDENGCLQTDDIESYTLGPIFGQDFRWQTWTGVPGESAEVSTEQALSGTQSVKVTGTPDGFGGVDQMYNLGNRTSGAWMVTYNLFIPAGNSFFTNIQKFEHPGPDEWGHQLQWNSNGTAEYNVNSTFNTFTYPQGVWFEAKHFVDLDNDFTEFFVNGVSIISHPYSYQAFSGTGTISLGGVNFFPITNLFGGSGSETDPNAIPLGYIDDVSLCAVPINDYNDTADASDNYPVGRTTVTWTITDGAGNTATCNHEVTVLDIEPPVVTCPEDITVSNDPGECGAVVTYNPTATDNCEIADLIILPPSGSFFDVGTTLVQVVAIDVNGNASTCSFNVTVNDDEAPVAICPEDITQSNDEGECGAIVSFDISATDNCPDVTVVSVPASGSFFDVGTTTVTVTATDVAGNSDVCTFDVTVNDDEDPVAICPEDITQSNDPR